MADETPTEPHKSEPTKTEPTTQPALAWTQQQLWNTLGDVLAARAQNIVKVEIQKHGAKACPISFAAPCHGEMSPLMELAQAVAVRERTLCVNALKAAFPEQADAIEAELMKRGPVVFAMNFQTSWSLAS